jgi:pimeloyl-ACP methyl ester carboxylesterase
VSPQLPPELAGTFRSRYVAVDGALLHVVTGGNGPPVLFVGGWPQTWHCWRRVMPIVADRHQVIVAEARGFGASDKPAGPYDMATVAAELVVLMDVLGHTGSFDFVGHDIGAWIGYAMAADHPLRVSRAVLLDAAIPGVSPPPSVMAAPDVNRRAWHFAFNRLGPELNEALVRGREQEFFGWQFRNKSGRPNSLPDADIQIYVDAYRDPETLRAGFDYYRALDADIEQNARRMRQKLNLPILIVAGEKGVGQSMVDGLAGIGTDMSARVLAGVGHYLPDEEPEVLAGIIVDFLSA